MTALEQLLKEELENEKQHSEMLENQYKESLKSIKSQYEQSLKELMKEQINTLNTIAGAYTQKLKQLCESKEQDEALESDLEKRLKALEHSLLRLQTIFRESFEELKYNKN